MRTQVLCCDYGEVEFAPKAKKLGCEFEALDTDGMTAEKVHELAEVSLARARMRGRTQG